MTPKVLLLSHLPQRDDVVDTLIIKELEKRSINAWKYSILNNPRPMIMAIKPDIVILPEIRIEYTRDLAKQLQEWGVKVVQKRCEMGVSAETEMGEELERCLFGNVNWHEHIDLDLVWGKGFADQLIAHGVPKKKIKVIGGIPFDCYFNNPPKVKGGNKKPRLLFCGGFGYADRSPIYAIPESIVGEKVNIELVKADRENREIFCKMMQDVMEHFGDKFDYGVRGHPGEAYTYYTERCGTKLNAVEGCVTPIAIAWADVLVHPGSTMAYEAHLMNKPSFNFRNTNLDAVVGSISPTLDNSKGLITKLENVKLKESNADKKVIRSLKRYYGKVDGQAHIRAVDAILKLELNKTKVPQEWPKDTIKYPNKFVQLNLDPRICSSCNNTVFIKKGITSAKCPWCGICMIIHPDQPMQIIQKG